MHIINDETGKSCLIIEIFEMKYSKQNIAPNNFMVLDYSNALIRCFKQRLNDIGRNTV